MSYSLEKVNKSQINAKITCKGEDWDNAIKAAYNKNKGKYVIEGFRKGKVPMNILVNRFGKEYFYEDAIDVVLDESYKEILEKENPEIISRPEVQIDAVKEDGVELTIMLFVTPEFDLAQYKGLTVKKDSTEVTDEELQTAVNKELEDRARMIEKDTPAEKGDTVILDYSGSIDGVKFDGGTAEKQTLVLGSNTFIPGFEDQLIGIKKNESKDVKVTFPKDYHAKDLAGKKAVFACTVYEVQSKELPTLDDEFVKDIDDELDTVDQWKDKLKKELEEKKSKQADYKLEDDLVNMIVNATEIEIPQPMIDEELDYRIEEMTRQMTQYGLKLDDYLKYTGSSIEKIREEKKDEAVRNIKVRLILEAIVKKENITFTKEEIEEKLKADNVPEEQYKEAYSYYANRVLTEKLFDFLKANNTIE